MTVSRIQEWARNVRAGKTSKGDKLGPVDHAKMNYRPFRRNFYIEVPELARMTDAEVAEYRKQLDGIKVCHWGGFLFEKLWPVAEPVASAYHGKLSCSSQHV